MRIYNYSKKSKSYLKFFLSYLSILIIPIIIITLILSNAVFHILETEIQDREMVSLNYSTHLLNSNLYDCIALSENLYSEANIKPFKFNSDISESINLINTLKTYSVSNNFVDKIFLKFYDDTYIYSDTSSYKVDSFFKTFGSDTSIDSKLKSVFTSISAPTIVDDTKDNIIYLAIPYIVNSNNVGTVLFSINTKKFNSMINLNDTNRKQLIIDSKNNVINLSNLYLTYKNKEDILSFVSSSEDKLKKSNSFTTSTSNYSVYITKLNSINLHLVTVTSNSHLFAELKDVSFLLIIAVLLAFILGSIAIHFFLKINYMPIKRLKDVSKKLHIDGNNNSSYNEENEFVLIENTLKSLSERNSELEYELSKNIPFMQNNLLTELINGNVSDSKRFLKDANEIGLNFTSKYHAVVLVKSNTSSDNAQVELNTLLSSNDIHNLSIEYNFLVNTFTNELKIFLIGVNSVLNIENKQFIIDDFTISIGSIQEELNQIANSYVDARTTLEISTSSKVNNTDLTKDFIEKYDTKVKEIKSLITDNEIDSAYSKVNEVSTLLREENLPFNLIRSVYFELVILFNTYIDKNKHIINYSTIDLVTLYQIDSLVELDDVFSEISNELFNLIKNKPTIEVPKLTIDKIKEYVLENYTDYSFSLQLVSDNFNISHSYLSQYFKDKTGITILDYITNLKMNKAKELLLTSEFTLKEIADQIGYSNVSSFIRRFKQVTSMTPGEYKRLNNKEDEI